MSTNPKNPNTNEETLVLDDEVVVTVGEMTKATLNHESAVVSELVHSELLSLDVLLFQLECNPEEALQLAQIYIGHRIKLGRDLLTDCTIAKDVLRISMNEVTVH